MSIKEIETLLFNNNIDNTTISNILTMIEPLSMESISTYINGYGETLAQSAALPSMSTELEPVIMALVKKMDLTSLYNVDNDNNVLIFQVVHYPEIVKEILSIGFDPDMRNGNEQTLFATIAEFGYLDLLKWLYNTYPNIDISDGISDSAIFLASLNGKMETVKYLLSLHVDLDDYWLKEYGHLYEKEIREFYTLENDYKLFLTPELNFLLPKNISDVFIF